MQGPYGYQSCTEWAPCLNKVDLTLPYHEKGNNDYLRKHFNACNELSVDRIG